jgi:hypothetical protein
MARSKCLISYMSLYDLHFLEQSSRGDKAFISNMLRLFLKQTPVMMQELEESILREDLPTQQLLLHKMPPTFKMIGFERGAEHLKNCSTHIKANQPIDPECIIQLKIELAQLYLEIQQWLDSRD